MSLTGPSKTGIFSVIFLAICALLLAGLLWSIEFAQSHSRDLTRAVQDMAERQEKDASALRSEVAKLRTSIERGLRSGVRIQAANGGEPDPQLPNFDQLDGAGKPKGTARPIGGMLVNSRSEPSTLNRWTTNEGIVRTIFNNVHDSLFSLDPKTLEPRASLAVRWKTSDDQLKYTFYLRKGVVFSDGTPFTAHDVKYTVDLINDPNVESDIYKPDYEYVKKIEVVDDHEIAFHYKEKHWRGLNTLGFSLRVFSAKWVREALEAIAAKDRTKYPKGSYSVEPGGEKFGELYNQLKDPCVGTGPYRYDAETSWVKGSHMTIYRSPNSWWFRDYVGKWNLAAQRWRFIIEDSVLWEEVKKRNVDVRVVDNDKWFDSFSKDDVLLENFRMYQYDHVGIAQSFVCWNNRKPIFADSRVRNAMTHLIDRKTMLEVFDHGIGAVATCYFKRWSKEYSFDLEPKLLDIPKASKLLDDAGWKDTNGDGIRDKDGADLRFSIMVPQGRKEFIVWGQLWQGHMKRAGVDMQIRPMEWSSFIQAYYDRDFDAACLYASHPDPWPEPYEEYLATQVDKKQSNHSGWINQEAIALLTKARSEFDPEKRRALYHRFNRIRWEEQPRTFLIHGEVIVVLDKRFHGVEVARRGLTPEDWYVPEDQRIYDDRGFKIRR